VPEGSATRGEGQAAASRAVANPKNQVQSVAKVFGVLKAFAPGADELTLAEVASRAGLDRGTAFRLVHTLEDLGYVRAVPGSRRYRLTLRCLELGFAALSAADLPSHATPLLREAVPAAADAASLGVLEQGEVVYLARVEAGLERHGVVRRPGTRVGAYATALGQAVMAWLPRQEQVAHLQAVDRVMLSERTLTDLDALLARLAEVRARGFAISDGENAYGLRTVAAPVLDAAGRPVAGISLTIAATRMGVEDFVREAAPVALRIAGELAEGLRLSLGAIALPRGGGR
jgi:IclR family pca regulon transcriptional regulator